jgi:hypothetical protein
MDTGIFNLAAICNLNFSAPNGIAKHDRRFMQFADSAGKFACGAQFYTRKELQPLFYSYLSYLKVLKDSSVSVGLLTATVRCCSPSCGGRCRAAGRLPAERPLLPYITTKTTERWTTIGNEGKSDLYVVAREGWKDR